jgi:N-acylneuraminate cytidylyltransferase
LLQNRLLQLKDVECDEIIVSTNCRVCSAQSFGIAGYDSRVKVVERPDFLCVPETKVSDIMVHIASVCAGDVIMWTHVTAPFVSVKDLVRGFVAYEEDNGFDSVASVNKIQNFLWDKDRKRVVNNYDRHNKWPNTQDLFPLFEFNHAFYVCNEPLLRSGERVGKNPFLYECHGSARIDIDWESDFVYAQNLATINDNVKSMTDIHESAMF